MPEYRTAGEVKRTFRKKSLKTIYRWLEQGLFPGARKVKGGWLIPAPDVDALLAKGDQDLVPAVIAHPRSRSGFVKRRRN